MFLTEEQQRTRKAGLSEDQHALRLTGIGASEIPAVCRKSPWMSPIDVWRAKVYGTRAATNIHMERGNLMEFFALQIFNIVRDFCHDLGNATVRHPEHHFLLATLDGAIMDGFDPVHVVECKAPRDRVEKIPTAYRYQMQQQMMVTGARAASLVAVHGEFHPAMLRAIRASENASEAFLEGLLEAEQYTILDMDWDDEIAAEIVSEGREFWYEYVLPKVPPPPDGSDSYSAYLAGDEPASDGQVIEADEELDELCIRLRQASLTKKEAETEEKRLQQLILAQAGDHDGCEFSAGRLTWKYQQRSSVSRQDFEALADMLGATPDQVARCISKSEPFRRFLF